MKTCTQCHQSKQEKEFNYRNRKLNQKQEQCRDCMNKHSRIHYYDNREYYVQKAQQYYKRMQKQNHQIIVDYLLNHPCIDCGEKDIVVLEFDHRGNKTKAIGEMTRKTLPLNLIKEIEKCDVRCANCHRRKTAKQFKNYRLNIALSSNR